MFSYDLCAVKKYPRQKTFSNHPSKSNNDASALAKSHYRDSRTCVHWYIAKHFLELSYNFFSKSEVRILDELRASLKRGLLISCSLTSLTCCNSPQNVRQLNIRRGKKLSFQLPHRQPQKAYFNFIIVSCEATS